MNRVVKCIALALCCQLVLGLQSQHAAVASAVDQPQGSSLNNLINSHRRVAMVRDLLGGDWPKTDQGEPKKPNHTTQFEDRDIPYLNMRVARPFDLADVLQRLIDDVVVAYEKKINR